MGWWEMMLDILCSDWYFVSCYESSNSKYNAGGWYFFFPEISLLDPVPFEIAYQPAMYCDLVSRSLEGNWIWNTNWIFSA